MRESLRMVLKTGNLHLIKALGNVFLSWQHRRLSYRGRALVACMLGISRFWYLGSTVPVSSDLAPRITRSVFAFVWNYKREWLSRSSASLPPSQGGSQHCFEAGITPGDVGKELPCRWVSSLEVLFSALPPPRFPVERVFASII